MGIKMSKDDGEALQKSVQEAKQALANIGAVTPKDGTDAPPPTPDLYMGDGGL